MIWHGGNAEEAVIDSQVDFHRTHSEYLNHITAANGRQMQEGGLSFSDWAANVLTMFKNLLANESYTI